MRKIIAMLVGLCLLALPAYADVVIPKSINATPEYLQDFGREQGCKDLVVMDTVSLVGPNGTFQVLDDGTPRIRLYSPPDFKAQYKLAIYYHELGHCMQYEEDVPLGSRPSLEQDADRRGADIACREGIDGVALQLELMQMMHDKYGYNGDTHHGTLDQRRAAARSAPSCKV